MKAGISTASLYPLETELALETLGRSGVKYTEIFFNCNSELEDSFLDLLTKIRDEYGMKITSIHPTMSLAESFMLFSAYERRLKEGLDNFKRYGEIAAKLGARYVILHGGKPNGVLDNKQYCERFMLVNENVRSGGGELLQENVVNFRAGNVSFLKMMVDNLGDEVGFCLDVKQSIRGGYTPFDVIDAVGANIRHLHISDNTQKNDCLLIGKGGFDFNALFCAMGKYNYDGAYILEVYRNAYKKYSELTGSLEYLK